ncbi:hypothetical protein N9F35_02255 [Gammaproteobacteria bacterium]|nr:hypothetical protein [Gammaproteobacteria bacterium]|tara:strand:+ start:70 stop:519 length:450 start_codon:yes stop_codon:yes gene_type:complete
MFGLFGGKKKFAKNVGDEILKIIDIVKIPEVNDTVEQIRKEMKESGSPQHHIDSVKWNELVASAVSQPLETDLDYVYQNFNEVQAAFYCISAYITRIYSNGKLKIFEEEQPEMYSALKLLWYVCAGAIENNYDAFANCIIVPEENPFPE